MSKQFEEASEKYINNNNALYAELGTTDAARGLTALRKLKRQLKLQERYNDEIVEILGSDNIGNAMKTLRGTLSGARVFLELPEPLTKYPQVWINGRLRDGKDPGVPGMTIRQCEREYRYLLPLLRDAWETAINQEEEEVSEMLKREILERYEELGPGEMSKVCYGITNNYEVILRLEKEQPVKVEKGASTMELQKALRTVAERDYGVGGVLETPTWD
jgi:tRNA nucleotidyltransferase/poly(A) polymerase